MDLSTIKKKLDAGDYKSPWEFVEDVFQMFENAYMYNKKTSKVFKCCLKVCICDALVWSCLCDSGKTCWRGNDSLLIWKPVKIRTAGPPRKIRLLLCYF